MATHAYLKIQNNFDVPRLLNNIINTPLPHSGEAQPLSWTRPQLQAEDVPQVLLPVGLLVPEHTQANTLGGEPQNTNSLIVSGLPQVYAIYLGGSEREGSDSCMTEVMRNCVSKTADGFYNNS